MQEEENTDGVGSTAKEIILYAITIDPKQPITMDLSRALLKAADEVVEMIRAEL
jgi:hypothetical protein